MSAKNIQNVPQSLTESSFVKAEGDRYRFDTVKGKGATRQELPWQIQNWEIDTKDQSYATTSFAIRLNADHFLQNLQDNLKERFPSFRKATLESDKKSGYWLLVEFLDQALDSDQSRLIEGADQASETLPHGLASLHLSVIQAVGQISMFMTRHCFLGNTPGPFFIELPKILNASLFGAMLSGKTNFNSYLLTLKSDELKSALIHTASINSQLESSLSEAEASQGQIKLSFEGKNWKLAWVSGEETPELLVPPMEILEQKEVARRFQRLDELILLEDFQGALEQCREYLDKNTQSLYLVRRWAFLSLWAGIPFEKKYLDLMMKFDPQNLMTLSLSVRHGLNERSRDSLLENLSKLGASLGQAIVEFDALDITSLTLPEMLGDAWNHKDDQRAVNCYERVLDARGEIPRILVKLIRLMRDIDDSASEESYMDRLLACEVPTRTRAAIYYRLAEIKQKADPSLACEWALKSWHTHKVQVRYATLAADLLIQLERPHDAVHVLVETSELLEGQTGEDRLNLELKIAGIWLDSMQRLDLAVERVNRAIELIGSNPETFDELIRLVQKFEDSNLLLDVTLKAIVVAEKRSDEKRLLLYSEMLLDLLGSVKDKEQSKAIYNTILNTTLLPAEELSSIMQRSDFDWSLHEIEQAMNNKVARLSSREQAPYLLLFGDVASDRLEDPERIFEYYEKAMNAGAMHTRSFDFLDTYFSRKGMNGERFVLLQKKLQQAQGSERAVLLRELYYFDEGVADTDKDRYALQILGEDADDVGPIEERLQYYEDLASSEAIVAMMLELNQLNLEKTVVCSLLKAGLGSLHSLGVGTRQNQFVQLLTRLQEAGEDPLELARLTVHYLWTADDKTPVRGALAILIHNKITPAQALADVLDVLDDDKVKIDLLLQMADKSADFEEILAHERSALRYARENPLLMNLKLEIQRRLVSKVEFTVIELEQFVRELRTLGRDSDTVSHLFAQLKLSSHGDQRAFVIQQFAETVKSFESAESDAAKALLSEISVQNFDSSARLRLVWLERFGIHADLHGLDFFEYLLKEQAHWSSRGLMLVIIEHYLSVEFHRETIHHRVNEFLVRLMAENHEEAFRYFIDEPTIAAVLETPTLHMVVDYMHQLKDEAGFEHFWWLALKRLEAEGETHAFLLESRRMFTELEASATFYEIISQIVDGFRPGVAPNVLFEIQLFYADFLAQSSLEFKRVRIMLETLHNERPEDARIWAALISNYREMKAEGELYELLMRVLEPLKENPRPLKDYQISITGLEIEYDELKAKVEKIRGLDFESAFSVETDPRGRAPTQISSRPFNLEQVTAIDIAVPVEGFSLNDITGVSRMNAIELPETSDVDTVYSTHNEFAFNGETGAIDSKPQANPMHTSIADLSHDGAMNFRLDSTKTNAMPKPNLGEMVSLYDNTNVFNPTPDLSIAPPPPPMQPVPQEFSSMPGTPVLPMQMIASEPSYTGNRGDLSSSWKQVAKTAKPEAGLLKELMARPLAELTEQVIAVQVAALVEDQISALDAFPNRIWRDPSSVKFELKWTGRMTRDQFHPGIKAPLARLLKALYPLFIQAFTHEMGLSGVADRLKLRPEEVMKIRKPIDFQDEVIQRSNLRFYVQAFQDSGYSLFHLPSIGDRFQFDFEKRDIYIDRNHYMTAPSSHIFHRLAFLLRAVSLDYFPFLHLSSSGEIYPFLMKCRRSLDQNDGMKRVLGTEKDPVRQLLTQAKDREHLIALFTEVGNLSVDRISQSVSHFIEQIYRLNLAETLDLIGAIETISGVDLTNPRASSFQRITQSSSAKSILSFAADLKFTKD